MKDYNDQIQSFQDQHKGLIESRYDMLTGALTGRGKSLERLLEGGYLHCVEAELQAVAEVVRAIDLNKYTLAQVARHARRRQAAWTRQVLNSRRLSRSTSVTATLMEEAHLEAIQQLIRPGIMGRSKLEELAKALDAGVAEAQWKPTKATPSKLTIAIDATNDPNFGEEWQDKTTLEEFAGGDEVTLYEVKGYGGRPTMLKAVAGGRYIIGREVSE